MERKKKAKLQDQNQAGRLMHKFPFWVWKTFSLSLHACHSPMDSSADGVSFTFCSRLLCAVTYQCTDWRSCGGQLLEQRRFSKPQDRKSNTDPEIYTRLSSNFQLKVYIYLLIKNCIYKTGQSFPKHLISKYRYTYPGLLSIFSQSGLWDFPDLDPPSGFVTSEKLRI